MRMITIVVVIIKMIMDIHVHDALFPRLGLSLPQSIWPESQHGSKPNSPSH